MKKRAATPEPVWISRALLDGMHHALIEQYGGAHGVLSGPLLDSALDRPRNVHAPLPGNDLAVLASSLCVGLSKNDGFRDGNKRAAFSAMAVFLRLNGLRLVAPEPEAVAVMIYVATDAWDEARLAEWIRLQTVELEA